MKLMKFQNIIPLCNIIIIPCHCDSDDDSGDMFPLFIIHYSIH